MKKLWQSELLPVVLLFAFSIWSSKVKFSNYVPMANEPTADKMNASLIYLFALTVLFKGIKNHRAFFKLLIAFRGLGALCLGLALAILGFNLDWAIIVSLYCAGFICSVCGFWIG